MFPFFKICVIYLVLVTAVQDIDCGYKRNEKELHLESVTPKQGRGIGISAWGLVILIVTLVLLGVAAYYIALFYPLICRLYNVKYQDACVQTD